MMCFSCRVTSDAKVVFLDVIPTPQDIISDFSYLCIIFEGKRRLKNLSPPIYNIRPQGVLMGIWKININRNR